MRLRGSRVPGATTLVIVIVIASLTAPADAQLDDPNGYCVAQNTHLDPRDVKRPNAPPVELPAGFERRRVSVAGFTTSIVEGGARGSEEAVLFMHGNPGNSLDFLGLFDAVPRGTREVAVDILGFGDADKPYDFPYDLASSRPLVDRLVRELGIERLHLVGHDVGSVVGIDFAARHPDKLSSAVLLAGGIMIGYVDHHFARVWKTPIVGEQNMRGVTRESFVNVLQAHNPRPLPREFIDRNYDYFDRATRCAVLKLYRAMPDLNRLGREHADALRPHDRPALVIWGDLDPFLPQHVAWNQREGFPSADVHVFRRSGHWPFVDEREQARRLMNEFLTRHVREQAGMRIRVTASPRAVRRNRRTRVSVRAALAHAPGQPVARARVTIGSRSATTDHHGRAVLRIRPRRTTRQGVVVRKAPLAPGRAWLRVKP